MINYNLIFKWVRWVALIPFSIGAGVLVSYVCSFMFDRSLPEPSEVITSNRFEPLIASFISLLVAYVIAPMYKFKTVLLMISLWLFVLLLLLLIVVFKVKLYSEEYSVLDGGMRLLMTVVGLASGFLVVWLVKRFKV